MNPLECLMVARVRARIAAEPAIAADPEVETEVAAMVRARPDAPYLLVQRVLMLEAALEHAEYEIARLRGDRTASYSVPVPPPGLGSVAPLVRPSGGDAACTDSGRLQQPAARLADDTVTSLWRGSSRRQPEAARNNPFMYLDDAREVLRLNPHTMSAPAAAVGGSVRRSTRILRADGESL